MKTKRLKPIHKQQLNFEVFLLSLNFFEFHDLGYTNEDFQLSIKQDGDKVHIVDYYECTGDEKLQDLKSCSEIDWEKGARKLTIDTPKTFQEALEVFIPAVFNGTEWTNEEKQEIINDYWDCLGRLLLKAIR